MEKKSTAKKDKPRFHYSVIPDELLIDRSMTSTEKLAWAFIFKWSNNKRSTTPCCLRSLKFLAKGLGVSERQMKRLVKELKVKRWLTTRRRYKRSSLMFLHKKRLKEDKSVSKSQG